MSSTSELVPALYIGVVHVVHPLDETVLMLMKNNYVFLKTIIDQHTL